MNPTNAAHCLHNQKPLNASNRFGLDYAAEASSFGKAPQPIIDVHSHINGKEASRIYKSVCDLYGIERIYSMSKFEQIDTLREVLGDRIQFIAVPNYWAEENKKHHMTDGFLKRIEEFHEQGARIVKFWVAPRSIDLAAEMGDPNLLKLDSPAKIAAMEAASELGMYFMTHVADPDTWFATKYADASVYGSKLQQYEPFEKLLDRFTQPWIAAHMGGWPENLEFLTGLLERHDNLYLDTSATKWQVRELSRHSHEELVAFFTKFKGRVLYGSDIVTTDDHLTPADDADEANEMQKKAGSREEAFDLYASRYWAYRTMFETEYAGESPIADPDLAMVEPTKYDVLSAPSLSGKSLPREILADIYHEAAATLLNPLLES